MDRSLTIAMTDGLQDRLDYDRDIRIGIQGQLASTVQNLVFTQEDPAALTTLVDTKPSQEELTSTLLTRVTVSSLVAGLATRQPSLDFASQVTVGTLQAGAVTVSGATRLEGDTVDVLGTMNANIVTAGTIQATNVTATVG